MKKEESVLEIMSYIDPILIEQADVGQMKKTFWPVRCKRYSKSEPLGGKTLTKD